MQKGRAAQTEARPHLFNVRMSDEEWDRLAEVAAHYSLSSSAAVRMLITQAHRAIQREKREARR